jgi:hypothetical protein
VGAFAGAWRFVQGAFMWKSISMFTSSSILGLLQVGWVDFVDIFLNFKIVAGWMGGLCGFWFGSLWYFHQFMSAPFYFW